MKKIRIILFTFAAVLMSITFVFAAEKSNLNPNAVYELTDSEGQPISIKFDYTHCEFVDFPSEGDIVKIWYDGDKTKDPDEVAVYTENGSKKGFYQTNNKQIYYGEIGRGLDGKDYDYDNRTIMLRFSSSSINNSYKYYIKQSVNVEAVTPAIERLEYSITNLTINPEDVSVPDGEDGRKLSLKMRERHYSVDNSPIYSAFCDGESVKLYLSDNSTKTYICKDVCTKKGVWVAGFVADDGDVLILDVDQPVEGTWLNLGENYVGVLIEGRTDIDPFILKVYVGDKPSDQGGQEAAIPVATSSEPKALNASTVSKIKANRSGSKMTIRWKKATKKQQKAFGEIELQYSDNKNFKNAKTRHIKKNKASCTIKKLNKKKTYYVRMRKIKKNDGVTYVSKWSKTKKVKK